MIRIFAIFLWFLTFGAPAALAAKSCYTMAEAEAEQGVRIHSELMVIGLNCQHVARAGNKNLYQAYREFSAANGRVFAEYETRLLGYYRRTGRGDPEGALNTLRTEFANKISLDAAKMRPDMFCAKYAPRIQKVSTMDQAKLRRWAATFFPSHPVTQPICEQ